MLSCVFTEERIEFGHTAVKPRSVECCSDACFSVDFSHLHIWSLSSTRVTISFFVTSLTKALLHQMEKRQTWRSVLEASSKKSPGCFKLLPLSVTETTCFCDPSMKQNLFELFPRYVAWRKHVSELYRLLFWPQGLFFALICIISCYTLY